MFRELLLQKNDFKSICCLSGIQGCDQARSFVREREIPCPVVWLLVMVPVHSPSVIIECLELCECVLLHVLIL